MGRSEMLKLPSDLLVAVTSRLVAVARALILTLDTTAPLLSVTVPLMAPKVCWASASCNEEVKIMKKKRIGSTGPEKTAVSRADDRRPEVTGEPSFGRTGRYSKGGSRGSRRIG